MSVRPRAWARCNRGSSASILERCGSAVVGTPDEIGQWLGLAVDDPGADVAGGEVLATGAAEALVAEAAECDEVAGGDVVTDAEAEASGKATAFAALGLSGTTPSNHSAVLGLNAAGED